MKIETKPFAPFLDHTGHVIPKDLVDLWERRTEVTNVLIQLSGMKMFIQNAEKLDDPLWREPFLDKAIADIESLYQNLATARPYAVCALCQGRPSTQTERCRGCKGTGFMSKFRWDRVPDKIKKMRTQS